MDLENHSETCEKIANSLSYEITTQPSDDIYLDAMCRAFNFLTTVIQSVNGGDSSLVNKEFVIYRVSTIISSVIPKQEHLKDILDLLSFEFFDNQFPVSNRTSSPHYFELITPLGIRYLRPRPNYPGISSFMFKSFAPFVNGRDFPTDVEITAIGFHLPKEENDLTRVDISFLEPKRKLDTNIGKSTFEKITDISHKQGVAFDVVISKMTELYLDELIK